MKAWPDLHSTGSPPWLRTMSSGVPGEARVVHDARARLLLQESLGQQPHQVVALDELAAARRRRSSGRSRRPRRARRRRPCGARRPPWRRGSPPASDWERRSGKCPSGSWLTLMNSNGRCGSSWSMISPAPPLPAFTTTFELAQLRDGRRSSAGARGTAPRMSSGRSRAGARRPSAAAGRSRSARACPCRPVSPLIGRASSRTNFMPL